MKDQLPQVRFAGTGVILPTTQGLTVPIETMNLRAVVVEAFHIYGDNMTQFLQVNTMDEGEELNRVGKVVWRQVIPLGTTEAQKNTWVRHGLDLTPLLKSHPDGMFQLRVAFYQPHVMWACSEPGPDVDWSTVPIVQGRQLRRQLLGLLRSRVPGGLLGAPQRPLPPRVLHDLLGRRPQTCSPCATCSCPTSA